MKNKYLGIILFLLITACGVSIYLYNHIPSTPTSTVIPAKAEIQASVSPLDPGSRSGMTAERQNEKQNLNPTTTGSRITVRDDSETTKIKMGTPTTSETLAIPQISVTLKILDKDYITAIAENSTVYDLMKQMMNVGQIQFSTQEYSGLGKFVEEINEIKNNKQAGIYWFYYINGQPANVGISNYHLKSNDVIYWKYDKAQF